MCKFRSGDSGNPLIEQQLPLLLNFRHVIQYCLSFHPHMWIIRVRKCCRFIPRCQLVRRNKCGQMPKVIICQTVAKSIISGCIGEDPFFKNPTKVTGERINSPIVDPLTPNQACRKILLLPHSRFDSTAMMTQYGGTTRVLIGTLIHLFSSFSLVNQSRWVRLSLAPRQWGRNERSLASNPFHCVPFYLRLAPGCITMNDKDHRRRRRRTLDEGSMANARDTPNAPENRKEFRVFHNIRVNYWITFVSFSIPISVCISFRVTLWQHHRQGGNSDRCYARQFSSLAQYRLQVCPDEIMIASIIPLNNPIDSIPQSIATTTTRCKSVWFWNPSFVHPHPDHELHPACDEVPGESFLLSALTTLRLFATRWGVGYRQRG